MVCRLRWWVSAALAALMVVSLSGPMFVSAQEPDVTAAEMLQTATVVVDTSIRSEPAPESAKLEFVVAGSTVTLMDIPITSPFDSALWVQVASLQTLGYLPLATLSTGEPDPVAEPEPLIIRWKTIQVLADVTCRTEPRDDASSIIELYPGQEVGLTAEPVDQWQAVVCADVAGFVPVSAFEIPPAPEPVDTGQPPVTETAIPTEIHADPTETPPPATETIDPTPTEAIPEPTTVTATPTEEPLVEVAAVTGSIGFVTGTDGDGVRCRSGASSSASTITVLPEGVSVTVRGNASGDWQPVICAGQNGFVWAGYLSASSSTSGNSRGSTGQVRNTDGDGLRCRSSASFNGSVITVLSPGATASIRGSLESGWVPILCAGQNGFVHSDFFGTSSESNSGSSSQSGFSSGQNVHVAGTNGDGVRFRSSASYSGAVISVLQEGSGLTVRSGSTGEWVAVTRSGSNGFIHMDFLAAGSGTSSGNQGSVPSSDLTAGSHAKVTDYLRLRSGASYSSQTLDIASAGIVVKITGGRSNGFYPVSWDGLSGYMHGDFLVWTSQSLSDRSSAPIGSTTPVGNAGSGSGSASGRSIVDYAMRYLGYPYVWAGRGPSSFDCAGYLYWVAYNVTGINLVGGVINQWTYGRPVPYGQLQPGDLVYFQNTYQPGLSHNGIYIGNNQFIHASNPTDGVRISNLTSSYYASRWYGARRIV